MPLRARTTASATLLALALAACGGGTTAPPPPGAPASLAVTCSTHSPLVNAPVAIRARVLTADGTPVAAGTSVGFAATGGTISAVTATDAAGDATARLVGATHGPVTLIVTVGSLPAHTEALTVIDPDEPVAVALAAAAATADVGATVHLTARVTPAGPDGTGAPGTAIADGTVVTFTSSAGTISAVTSTVGGEATATLGGISAPALVFVTASAGGVQSLPVLVEFTDPTAPTSVTLAGLPAAGVTGDQGPVALTATVLTLSGAPVPAGTPVAFSVLAGAGTLSAAEGRADAAGRASVTLRSAAEGAVTVVATAAGGVTGSVTVAFTDPSRPVALALTASTPTARLDRQVPVLLTVVVSPADPAHGRVADGTPVTFTVTTGAGSLSSPSAPTAGGVASVALASDVEGSVTVQAAAAGLSGTATVTFTNPSRPAAVALAANPPAGRLDGQGPVTLTATVAPADPVLGAIADGTAVTFAISAGAGTLSSLAATTTGGVASVTLAGGAEGSVTVRATAGAASGSATVTFTNPSKAVALSLAANPPAGRLDTGGPVTLTATVTPADPVLGRVADGTPVSFAVTSGNGTLSAASAPTSGGVATVTLAGGAEGSVSVRATVAGSVQGSVTVPFSNPSRPVAVSLSASPGAGKTGGQGPVTLSATVVPADQLLGQVADGTPVAFTITAGSGTLSAPSSPTAGGVATVTLDAASAGTVTVTASVGAPAITSQAVSVPFTTQPTLAIVKVRTTGALPAGAAIGGVSAVVSASPSTGLTLAAGDVTASGAAAGNLLAANTADLSATRLALISAAGFQPGEVATLTFHVAPGTFPAAQDFTVALSGPGVIDLAGETLALSVAIQGVTLQ